MQFFIETTDLPLIEKSVKQGFLHGIVTTPALLLKHNSPLQLIKDLLAAQPGPVVVDVLSDFYHRGAAIASLSPRIVLRIPAIEQTWELIHQLSKNKVSIMVGAIFSPVHAVLAATAGAAYASLHLARMLKSGDRPFEQIESIQRMIQNYQFPTHITVLHPKTVEQIKACAEIGVFGIVIRDDLCKELTETHELAAFHVEQWAAEWNSLMQKIDENV